MRKEKVTSDFFKNLFSLNHMMKLILAALVMILPVIGGISLYYFNRHVNSAEIFLFCPKNYTTDTNSTAIIMARNAVTNKVIAGKSIEVTLLKIKSPRTLLQQKMITGEDGIALFSLGKLPSGIYIIDVKCDELTIKKNITVEKNISAMLSTDKPAYQPGQTVRVRTLVLNPVNNKPVDNLDIELQIHDPDQNMVFSEILKTSAYGIAATDFPLANVVRQGTYSITAAHNYAKPAKATFEVKQYKLPPYRLSLNTERKFYAPGDTIGGTITANYIFGKPVANAEIKIQATTKIKKAQQDENANQGMFGGFGKPVYKQVEFPLIIKTIEGKTDDAGKINFELPFPHQLEGIDLNSEDSECAISVTATSTDGHMQHAERSVIVTKTPLRVNVSPEYGKLIQGTTNRLYVSVMYPTGEPATAKITVDNKSFDSDRLGMIMYEIPRIKQNQRLTFSIEDKNGNTTKCDYTPGYSFGNFVLKTNKSIYHSGEPLRLEVVGNGLSGKIIILAAKGKCVLHTASLELKDNNGHSELKLPENITGTIQLYAFKILPQGKMIKDMRLVQINSGQQINIESRFDKPEYRPGETAQINLAIKDSQGHPMPGAFSISAIDEAVFAYFPQKQISTRAYFMVQEELLKTQYQAMAPEMLLATHPNQTIAAFLLSQAQEINNMSIDACDKYSDRESKFIDEKITNGNRLFTVFAIVMLLIAALFVCPYAGLVINRNNRYYDNALIRPKEEVREIQTLLSSMHLKLIFINGMLVEWFIICSMNLLEPFKESAPLLAVLLIVINITLPFVLLLLINRGQKNITTLISISDNQNIKKHIERLPLFVTFFVIALCGIILGEIFFPDASGVSLSLIFLISLFAIPVYAVGIIKNCICTREDYELKNITFGTLGSGIGLYKNSYRSMWILTTVFFVGPIVATYFFAFISILSMFMPFVCIVDKLGGGGGGGGFGSGFSPYTAKESFAAPITGQYFEISGDVPGKTEYPRIRRYFPETLYWEPQLITDNNGNASISLNVADSITNYRFSADAITGAGQLATLEKTLKVYQSFFVDFNPPATVTSGDEISIPVMLYNYQPKPQKLAISIPNGNGIKLELPSGTINVPPMSAQKIYVKAIFPTPGKYKLCFAVTGDKSKDAIEREITVTPNGMKVEKSINSILTKNSVYEAVIPDDAIPGGRELYAKLYQSRLPEIIESLKGMLREPYGCFEQSSSITYPNILIMKYFKNKNITGGKQERRAKSLIIQGYQRLLTFITPDRGFSYFSGGKAETRLTAYALMQLQEMKGIIPVDDAIITNSIDCLEKAQNTDGSWSSSREYGNISLPLAFTAFVVIAMEQSGFNKFTGRNKALEYIRANHQKSNDSYELAWCANALSSEDKNEAINIIDRLKEMKTQGEKNIWWSPSKNHCGIFYTSGQSLEIETTALVVSAMIKTNSHPQLVQQGISWLVENKSPKGLWGTTQSTVQVLNALLLFDRQDHRQSSMESFDIEVTCNDMKKSSHIDSRSVDVMQYMSFPCGLNNGTNKIIINGQNKPSMSYQVVYSYYLPWPEKIKPQVTAGVNPELELRVDYGRGTYHTGDTTECKIYLDNTGLNQMNMGMIIMEIPPGFEADATSIEQMLTNCEVDNYSLADNQLVLYLKTLEKNKPLLLKFKLKAIYPAKITTVPVKAYPYYQPENIAFSKAQKLLINPAQTEGKE